MLTQYEIASLITQWLGFLCLLSIAIDVDKICKRKPR
jgi:hypothetical protein